MRERQIQRQRDLPAQPEIQRVDIGSADKDIGRVFVAEEGVGPGIAINGPGETAAAGADIAVIAIAQMHIALDPATAIVQ